MHCPHCTNELQRVEESDELSHAAACAGASRDPAGRQRRVGAVEVDGVLERSIWPELAGEESGRADAVHVVRLVRQGETQGMQQNARQSSVLLAAAVSHRTSHSGVTLTTRRCGVCPLSVSKADDLALAPREVERTRA